MFRTSYVHHQEGHFCMQFFYFMFFFHLCKQSCRWKVMLDTNGLPDDEHMMFETCRRQQELKQNINLKSVHFVCLRYIINSRVLTVKCKTYYEITWKILGHGWPEFGNIIHKQNSNKVVNVRINVTIVDVEKQ
jgi:hypothetical protein